MKSSYDVSVAAPVEDVWASLTDVDSVLAALPGAALAREESAVTGSLKLKLGSAQITYRVSIRAEVGAAEFRTAVLTLTGKEARGSGTITATLSVSVQSVGTDSRVEVGGDIEATGRGETADARDWAKVLETLVNSVLPQPAPASVPPPAAPRPPLAVVSPPPPPAGSSGSARPSPKVIAAVVGLLFLLLIRRRRKRRG